MSRTPVLLAWKSHGLRSLVGYSPWGRKESDMTKRLHFLSLSYKIKQTHIPTPILQRLICLSVQLSHSVVSNSLRPHGLEHTRLLCPLSTPEPTQTHVHRVGDTIQPSYPLSSPSPPAFNLVQHQDLFKWVSSWHHMAKVLEFQLQHQSFQWIFRTDFL